MNSTQKFRTDERNGWCAVLRSASPFGVGLAVAMFAGGCVAPWPHTSERSPEVRAHVLEAGSKLPIEGAKICWVGAPKACAVSDSSGAFHLRRRRNFHWAYIGPEANDWPHWKREYELMITHPEYQAQQFDVHDRDRGSYTANGTWVLSDVCLRKIGP